MHGLSMGPWSPSLGVCRLEARREALLPNLLPLEPAQRLVKEGAAQRGDPAAQQLPPGLP